MIIWKRGERMVTYYAWTEKDKPHFSRRPSAAVLKESDVYKVLAWIRQKIPHDTFGVLQDDAEFIRKDHPAEHTPEPKFDDLQMSIPECAHG